MPLKIHMQAVPKTSRFIAYTSYIPFNSFPRPGAIFVCTGPNSRDSLSSANHLAGLWRVAGKKAQAEELLQETLKACRSAFGDM
jgi:hypothetical protein